MNGCRNNHWSRREFLGGLTLAGTAGLIGVNPKAAFADPPPETKTIRLIYDPGDYVGCYAPVYIAGQLMRAEGFTNVRYVKDSEGIEPQTLAAGHADMSAVFGPDHIVGIDAGLPLVALTGLHGGCLELVASERVRTIRDLKGKTVAVTAKGFGDHLFVSNMLAYIGLDPRKDVQWVVPKHSVPEMIQLLAEKKVDAMLAWPPGAQQLRARKIGHVILSTATDRPWSEYFCCIVIARRQFVQEYPLATKRALRAIMKANQLCTSEPERSARLLMDKGFTAGASYQEALQTLKDVRYDQWRDYDPGASLLFYALRLRENGFIKSMPQKIIAQGTDWRFLNELKKELKG